MTELSNSASVHTGSPSILAGYRSDWEGDCVLPIGSVAHFRPIRPEDADALVAFHEGLSPETVRLRFFNVHPHLLPAELARFTNVDFHDRVAIVAFVGAVRDASFPEQREFGDGVATVSFGIDPCEHSLEARRRRAAGDGT